MSSSRPRGSLYEGNRPKGTLYEEVPSSEDERSSHGYDQGYYERPRGSHSRQYFAPDGARYANPGTSTASTSNRVIYRRKELDAKLNVDFEADEQILKHALDSGKLFVNDAHRRVQFILRDPDFRRWMTDNQSRIIVIDGPLHGDTGDKRSSELTTYAAGFHGWNQIWNDSPSASFFCGYFESPSEELLVALLRSLCDQLLRNKKLAEDFGCGFSNKEADRLEEGYSKQLFVLLGCLITNILRRGGRLLCSVDGLHCMKRDEPKQFFDLLSFFGNLCRIANKSGNDSSLKIVLTYPRVWDQELFFCRNRKSVSENMVQPSDLKRNETGLVTGHHLNAILRQSN